MEKFLKLIKFKRFVDKQVPLDSWVGGKGHKESNSLWGIIKTKASFVEISMKGHQVVWIPFTYEVLPMWTFDQFFTL